MSMADKPKLSLVVDSLALQTDGMQEVDGILSVPVVIAREMILDYDGLKVLKPFDELEAASKFADGIPVTREHPDAGIVTDRAEVLGFLRNPIAENDELKGILEISNTDLIADIKDGKIKEVSGRFFCNLDHTPGTFNNGMYDAVQRAIFMNHVAIVDAGRCSIKDGCGLQTDAKPEPADLTAITAERDALKAELESIVKVEKDNIIKELTELQDAKTAEDLSKLRLDELKTELDMVRELKTDRLTFGKKSTGSVVDDAYAKVGR